MIGAVYMGTKPCKKVQGGRGAQEFYGVFAAKLKDAQNYIFANATPIAIYQIPSLLNDLKSTCSECKHFYPDVWDLKNKFILCIHSGFSRQNFKMCMKRLDENKTSDQKRM